MRPQFIALAFLATTILTHATDRPPNILLIMADDMGAEVLPAYGNTTHVTPHLDRMAKDGAVFENAYATPVCSPTRAMILTGLHPNRTGILERMDSPSDREAKKNRLPAHLKTFAQHFKEAGYATAIAGKWHLGSFETYPDQPASHGFDEHCLWVQHWGNQKRSRYFAPCNWENEQFVEHPKKIFGPDYYCDFLIDFMDRNQDRPFLAYFPMNLIHTPLITPPGDLSAAKALFPEDFGSKEKLVGLMTYYTDLLVGRLLQKLDDIGQADNTIVIFTGDNGSISSVTAHLGDFRIAGAKRTMNEAGTRVPFIARWPGKIPPGRRDSLLSLLDVLPTLGGATGIPVQHQVDGMDLSHNLFGEVGKDREIFAMAFEGECYFVRNKRFRLHEDGRLYDASVDELETRYHWETLPKDAFPEQRQALQKHLDRFMQIQKTDDSYQIIPFGTKGDEYKNAQQRQRKK